MSVEDPTTGLIVEVFRPSPEYLTSSEDEHDGRFAIISPLQAYVAREEGVGRSGHPRSDAFILRA